jgi:hypothetical protein
MWNMLDVIVEFLKDRFGEKRIMRWGLAASIILLVAVVYVFFVKELSTTLDKYYEYKLEKCKDAALTTAQIASSHDETILKHAISRFDELYYGELVLFEGKSLEKAMVEFRSLFGPKDIDIAYEDFLNKRKENPVSFRRGALHVSDSCYQEVTPSLFSAIIDRLIPRPRQKY